VVGSLPVSDGGMGSPEAGCLIVLNNMGMPAETITGPTVNGSPLIDGPWDMTAAEHGNKATMFVANVLTGIGSATPTSPVHGGTVVRVDLKVSEHAMPKVSDMTVIANSIDIRPDPAALVVGPTGLGLSGDTLYVADSVNSAILAVSDPFHRMTPGTNTVVSSGNNLNDPLGMAIAPNGNVLTVNGGDGNAVETTPDGMQLAPVTLDTNAGGGGNLFGIALTPDNHGLYFVDDFGADNALFVALRHGH
jgi:hypothetical protein